MKNIITITVFFLFQIALIANAQNIEPIQIFDSPEATAAFKAEPGGYLHPEANVFCPKVLDNGSVLNQITKSPPEGIDFLGGMACEYKSDSGLVGFVIISKHSAVNPQPLTDAWCKSLKPARDLNPSPVMPWDQKREAVHQLPDQLAKNVGLVGKRVWGCGAFRDLFDPKGYVVISIHAIRDSDWDVAAVYRPPAKIGGQRTGIMTDPASAFWTLTTLAAVTSRIN